MAPAQNSNVALAQESMEQRLTRLLAENAAIKAQVAKVTAELASRPAVGAFSLGITEHREPGTRKRADGTVDPNDKGAKGGSVRITLGKQNVYPSKAMVLAILDHADECRQFVTDNAAKLTR